MEPVDDPAPTEEIVVICLLGSGVEIFRKRGESWKMRIRGELDVLGFHRETKSQISFNRVTALHFIAVKETSSSAWLASGSFKKRTTVPVHCRTFAAWVYKRP